MPLVYMCAIIFCFCFLWCLIFKQKIEQSIAPAFFIIILLLYPFGMFNRLDLGFFFVVGMAVLCFGVGIVMLIKIPSLLTLIRKLFLTQGALAIVVVLAFSIISTYGRMIYNFDEFTHWGIFIKHMLHTSSYANVPNYHLGFSDYPPGISLLGYFLGMLNSAKVVEWHCYFITLFFTFSLLLPAFSYLKKKQKLVWLPIMIIVLLVQGLFFIQFGYLTIYADPILGILAGYILYCYFSKDSHTIGDIVNLALAFFVLPQVKLSGIIVSSILLCILFFDSYFSDRRMSKSSSFENAKGWRGIAERYHSLYNAY